MVLSKEAQIKALSIFAGQPRTLSEKPAAAHLHQQGRNLSALRRASLLAALYEESPRTTQPPNSPFHEEQAPRRRRYPTQNLPETPHIHPETPNSGAH